MQHCHDFFVTDRGPRMTREETLEEQGNANEDAVLRNHAFAEFRAGRIKAAVAVGEHPAEHPVVGGERSLIELDQDHKQLAWNVP